MINLSDLLMIGFNDTDKIFKIPIKVKEYSVAVRRTSKQKELSIQYLI